MKSDARLCRIAMQRIIKRLGWGLAKETKMIADLMPRWLWVLLRMDRTEQMPEDAWTWRHTMRYGRDPAKIAEDYRRYMEQR